MGNRSKLVFLFLDGFGMGGATVLNPIFSHAVFAEIAGLPLLDGVDIRSDGLVVKGIDACLGVGGIPQSATGQTALFTGLNAAQFLGYHLPAFPCPSARADPKVEPLPGGLGFREERYVRECLPQGILRSGRFRRSPAFSHYGRLPGCGPAFARDRELLRGRRRVLGHHRHVYPEAYAISD